MNVRNDHPLLEGPAVSARIEEVRALETERAGVRGGVRQLEDPRLLGADPAADELAVGLHSRHAHHLCEDDLGVPGGEVVADLVVPCSNVHLEPPDALGEAGVWTVHVEEDDTTSFVHDAVAPARLGGVERSRARTDDLAAADES